MNVLNGTTFDMCLSPAREGLTEVAPCAPGHPEAFALPAVMTLEELGVKPELAVHSSGEIELAKRKLIDTGILKKPYNWLILYGLPFNVGRTLVSGTWVSDAQDMTQHMFLMVDQIRKIDPTSVISVCAAGRASLYMTTLATMMGLHIRVGTEDTPWKYPNSDVKLKDNLEMFNMAKDIAGLLGRKPATANEYRAAGRQAARTKGIARRDGASVSAAPGTTEVDDRMRRPTQTKPAPHGRHRCTALHRGTSSCSAKPARRSKAASKRSRAKGE